MSVKDGEFYVGNAINSILCQTFQNFEFLIVNDGSTDCTFDVLKYYEKLDSRIKVFENNKNIGLTKSLNLLIKKAQGEYIARQDADDLSTSERLDLQLKILKYKNLDACTTLAESIQTNKTLHKISSHLPKKLIINLKNPFIHGTLFIKKSVLISLGGYNEKFYYAQDYRLIKDLISSGYKLKILYKKLYKLNTINNISTNYLIDQNKFASFVRKNISPN